jgi:hypothetical protein
VLTKAKVGVNRFGARKYASLPSKSRDGLLHKVVKVRKRGSRNYRYMCDCEHYLYRQRTCNHIKKFKEMEGANGKV